MMITSLVILGQPVGALIFMAFASQSPIWIGLVVVLYVVCYVLMRKYKEPLHDWIENQALYHGKKPEETAA